jgi:hypothetical protein
MGVFDTLDLECCHEHIERHLLCIPSQKGQRSMTPTESMSETRLFLRITSSATNRGLSASISSAYLAEQAIDKCDKGFSSQLSNASRLRPKSIKCRSPSYIQHKYLLLKADSVKSFLGHALIAIVVELIDHGFEFLLLEPRLSQVAGHAP